MDEDINKCLQPPAYSYHQKVGACYTRPAYRDGRIKRAVKVFSISDESTYLLLHGVPSLSLEKQLKDKCKSMGKLESLRVLENYPNREQFTQVYLVKFESVHVARIVKRKLDETSFYGSILHVCYAPEYETIAECRIKLHTLRRHNANVARKCDYDYQERLRGNSNLHHIPSVSQSDVSGTGFSANLTKPGVFCPAGQAELKPICLHRTASSLLAPLPPFSAELASTSTVDAIIDFGSSGSAQDDARAYWRRMGLDFRVPRPRLVADARAANNDGGGDDDLTALQPNQNTMFPRPYADNSALVLQPQCNLPLPVLQALSCRSYLDRVSLASASASLPSSSAATISSSKNNRQCSLTLLSVTSSGASALANRHLKQRAICRESLSSSGQPLAITSRPFLSFLPRVLASTSAAAVRVEKRCSLAIDDARLSGPNLVGTDVLSAAQLAETALLIGPQQGPSSVPPRIKRLRGEDDGCVVSTKRKRVVFHRGVASLTSQYSEERGSYSQASEEAAAGDSSKMAMKSLIDDCNEEDPLDTTAIGIRTKIGALSWSTL